ncbi:ferrochelatase [Veillonella parvula]|uniref:Ferrochelatase n=1 Tax=Veillonella parvula TaxID=29466 RepID=A0A6N2ZG34_VEIPA|nr:ferrochelatase [Veillonella parvula]MDU2805894.1 ferrochelatase [Veillonella sp.]MDU0988325.1 ferrochelatase [Veillonella parvula]MDU1044838.1 ferrochelatase [Veillonella parvula]MDU2853580.1 ferrochelatase [Veillonella sp.]CAB1274239.1 Ferrochelatase [Veillonella parvula]
MKVEKKGLLFLSYGSPLSKDDLVPYMTSIRRGRVPTKEEIANLTKRYDTIGQWENVELQTMAECQYRTLLTLLPTMPSAIGFLHMKPSIADAVDSLVQQGVEHIIAIVTAPFFTALGTGAYEKQVQVAISNHDNMTFDFIRSWWDQPTFKEYWVKAVSKCVNINKDLFVIFSAHSIPLINNHGGDSYALALEESAKEIAEHCKLPKWTVAWQSAAPHGQWLGPTVEDAINEALQTGANRIVFVPFGFVSNHVEVLYDNDVECKELVEAESATYMRAPMPNCNETFLQAMASAIIERIHS